ncbi:helix-turn-helix transcriptional regulator [Halobium salinum]|uniref:Helix-turn-helix transcriptional regulator n=1 Tax=Halobium salinum TaxID=1364940 RepID=A0ABD5PE42_9EURY|nr:MarR family transcriptional regulator [Halobium salinum]
MDDDDITEVVKRAPILDALRDEPQDANRLEERLAFSRSTIHRATNHLADLGLIRKREGRFELTAFGRLVGGRLVDFRRDLDTADRLSPFLDAVEGTVELPLDGLAEAEVSGPERGRAHVAVKRISDLMAGSESLRTFSGVVSPIYVDICCREAKAGARVRAVFDRRVVDVLFNEYAADYREAIEQGELEVRIHDDCPFELFLFDDRVGMTAHDDAGQVTQFVESDDPSVYEWAEGLFERYRSEAEFATVF